MANILYGINGEGSGHWSRSKEVIEHLIESGHAITIVTSGRAVPNLSKYYPVEEIFGFSFIYSEGKLNEFATFLKNANFIPGAAKSLKRVIDLIKDKNIDLVITDFEPLSCLASNIKRIPAISIDNQHFITETETDFPEGDLVPANIAKAVISMLTPGAEAYLVLSFFEAGVKNNKISVVPPIVRREILNLKPTVGDHLITYFTHSFDSMAEVFKKVDSKFIFYGAAEDKQVGNITFKKFDQAGFINDLASSKGVVATAGFSLISEALSLGKPYLAWPAENQFEQTFNAYHLERCGYGKYVRDMTVENINDFLSRIDEYSENLKKYPYKDNQKLFTKLDQLIGQYNK